MMIPESPDPTETRRALTAVLELLRPGFHAVYRAVEANLAGTGVSAPMRGLLGLLVDGQPRTAPQIARELRIPRQFALKLIDSLAAMDLVRRQPNPAHRRSPLVMLTASGRDLTDLILAREWEAARPLADAFTAAEFRVAARVLDSLVQHFDLPETEAHGRD